MRNIRKSTLRVRGINFFKKLVVDRRHPGFGAYLEELKRISNFIGILVEFLPTVPDQPYLQGYPITINRNRILDHTTRG